jgi:hypothetical protein
MGSSVAITEAAVDLATAQKSLIARPGGHARVKELKLRPANAHCGHARARRPRPSGYQSSGGSSAMMWPVVGCSPPRRQLRTSLACPGGGDGAQANGEHRNRLVPENSRGMAQGGSENEPRAVQAYQGRGT